MKSVACKHQTLQGQGQCCPDHALEPSLGRFMLLLLMAETALELQLGQMGLTTWFHHNRSFWSCLRTKRNNVQKFLANFLQPFSFLSQYKGKATLSERREAEEEAKSHGAERPRNWESTLKLEKWWGDFALTPPMFLYWESAYFCWRYLCVGKTGCGGKGHNDLFRGVPAAFPCSVSLMLLGLGSQCSCI